MGLSVYQLKRQLAYLAGTSAWAVSPQGLVYTGGSFVSEDLEGNFRLGSMLIDGPEAKGGADNSAGLAPFCRVRVTQTEWDKRSSAPRMERVVLQMWSTAGGGAVPGTPSLTGYDSHGINQVTGVKRDPTTPLGVSQGRDVDELIGRFGELHGFFVDSVDGFQGRCRTTQAMRPVNGVMVLKRGLEIEALNPLAANYYHPGRNIAASSQPTGVSFTIVNNATVNGQTLTVIANGTTYNFIGGTTFAIGATANITAANLVTAILASGLSALTVVFSGGNFVGINRGVGCTSISSSVSTGGAVTATSTFGDVSVSWSLPPLRFDTLGGVLRRSASGGAAPATPTAGTGVAITGGALGTTATISGISAGTYYLSYFMGYAESPASQAAITADAYSDPISIQVVVT